MTSASVLTEQLAAQSGQNYIDASHLAGRYNGYFTKAEIQSHLSRVSLSIFAYGLDHNLLSQLEEYLLRQNPPSSHAIGVNDTHLNIYLPIINDDVPDFQNVLSCVTKFLADRGIASDIIESSSEEASDWTRRSISTHPNSNPGYFLGLFGSFLGAMPGFLLWFIFSLISSYEFLARYPASIARLSPWFIFSVMITCGSYWGFLLLSDATRKKSLVMSIPITLSTIFISNHMTYAYIIYAANAELHYFNAVFHIASYIDRFGLTTYYWLSFFLGIFCSFICYFALLRFRERGWVKQNP